MTYHAGTRRTSRRASGEVLGSCYVDAVTALSYDRTKDNATLLPINIAHCAGVARVRKRTTRANNAEPSRSFFIVVL